MRREGISARGEWGAGGQGISARGEWGAGGQGLQREKENKERKRIEKRHICALRVFHV